VPDALTYTLMGIYWLAAITLQLYGLNCYVMIHLFRRRRDERRREEQLVLGAFAERFVDDDLPPVTTQLPIFNERNDVERLVRAVCAFDYPSGKHEIQVLDDSTDETRELVARIVRELRAEGHDIHHIHRTDRSGYKAGALQHGLERARGEYVAVFDADFVPPPEFLRKTVPFLMTDPEVGFVQTRWGHRNRDFSPLTRVQAIGIDGHFVIEQAARSWNGLFFNFNGTGGIWRKRAIDEAGGWQSDTLTEDLDLSYRTQLAGWRPEFLVDVVTPAEIPTDINALKSQQHRWAKGSIQTAKKLLPTIWARGDLPVFKRLQSTLHLTHYMVHPLMLVMTILLFPLLVLTEFTFRTAWMTVPIVLMLLALFAPSTMYFASQRLTVEKWKRTVWLLPFLMSVGIGLAVNNTRAVMQGLFGRGGGEFVRTPKLGDAAETRTGAGGLHYRLPRGWIFMAEIFMGMWALAAFVEYLYISKIFASPILLIHAVGFTYIGVLSLMHDLRARRRSA
jgi:cellulose synthase/poly-beta-1,6-N-acetylglucosamine synthase-like glycosyltransferase